MVLLVLLLLLTMMPQNGLEANGADSFLNLILLASAAVDTDCHLSSPIQPAPQGESGGTSVFGTPTFKSPWSLCLFVCFFLSISLFP